MAGDDGGRNRQFLDQTLQEHHPGRIRNSGPGGYQGDRPLSFMSDAKVRRDLTIDGREFAEPYKKRLNCTKHPLSATFVDAFVDLVDRVLNSGTVKLVIQTFIGGGAYASPEVAPPPSNRPVSN